MTHLGAALAPLLRWLPPLVLLWLAWSFGRTLRAGFTPLIERICRRAVAAPSARLCRYTRGLTAVWCGYFVLAATAASMAGAAGLASFGGLGALVWSGTLLLFVGEWFLRRLVFPEFEFPGLWRQVVDTFAVWRSRESRGVSAR